MGETIGITSETTDAALITRWLAGDQRAASALVERHVSSVARFVGSLGERDRTEELVQDTFVRAFQAIGTFRSDSLFRTWLFTIAKRLVLDHRRSERRQREVVELQEDHLVASYDALDGLVGDERIQQVHAAMQGLAPMQREVFTMRVTEGLPYEEIAQVVGSSAGACRVHYHNALKTIKERVTDA
ncbi:MAG: RNA polymerase sigma factor [Gemmatimonadaceae bacterium]